jgi:hypothetical protein
VPGGKCRRGVTNKLLAGQTLLTTEAYPACRNN